ncbi:excalibur calcium-binding domain-containing protein [Haloactinospora alba]|uniref:Excalibur calcium-binding domain-containing protein n=1 Tax=Haloactinospora alba TaxID=405555 RepID=A0A543NKB6_9ACTN|nr:excalibur calcium-binding domain-containing protein [Haloactinospora alba]
MRTQSPISSQSSDSGIRITLSLIGTLFVVAVVLGGIQGCSSGSADETGAAAPSTSAAPTVTVSTTRTQEVEVTTTETVETTATETVRETATEEEPAQGGNGPDEYYENCDAARAAGAAPVREGDPGYGPHLDRDGDGVGCE